jgi:hypothetical protein|tara:strand:+ start:131 stop:574 length:444 start_codon:yes stop_codon:yes gene_type:complete
MKKAFLFVALFFTTITYAQVQDAQVQGEMEIGLGSLGYAYTDGLLNEGDASGIQAQFDYDFIQGPWRAAIGIKVLALPGYTFIQPGVKLGRDGINLNISVLPSGLTYYGLSSRIGVYKRHAIDLSLQVAADVDYVYSTACLGYSYRF